MDKNIELELAKASLDLHINDEEELSAVSVTEHLKTLKKHDEDEYENYLNKLDPQSLGDAAIEMPDYMLKDVIENLPTDKIVEAIEELESDDQAEIIDKIDDIDENKAKELLNELDDDDKQDILTISRYADNSAGAYMQAELFSANLSEKLADVIDKLKKLKAEDEIENIFHLFIVDDTGHLIYAVPLHELIVWDFRKSLSELLKIHDSDEFRPHFAHANDDIEDVAQLVQEFDLGSVGIVDENGILIGRITTDDIHDFITESATEQIYHLAGVNDEAEAEDDSIIKAGRARGIWLGVNLVTALLSSFIIALFDTTIQQYVALAVLMPIVASMGGNTGTQALTVTVRRLALGEIEFKDAKSVIVRELKIAMINGTFFAVAMGIIAYFWFNMPLLGVVIAAAMMINLSCSGIFGAVIPLTLKELKIDPAIGSSVLLTTTTDIIGFFSFLGLATWILL